LTVKASANHPFYTIDGWKPLDQLREGGRIAAVARVPESGSSSRPRAQTDDRLATGHGCSATAGALLATPVLGRRPGPDVFWDTIASITPLGEQPVFDATVPGTHNFIANGIIAHNSIEQDADVVMFVYREEMYKPDTAEKGKALILLSKQRNGPTGEVPLTFLRESTKFVPYTPVMAGETEEAF
jgi:replicative DNA helicase